MKLANSTPDHLKALWDIIPVFFFSRRLWSLAPETKMNKSKADSYTQIWVLGKLREFDQPRKKWRDREEGFHTSVLNTGHK